MQISRSSLSFGNINFDCRIFTNCSPLPEKTNELKTIIVKEGIDKDVDMYFGPFLYPSCDISIANTKNDINDRNEQDLTNCVLSKKINIVKEPVENIVEAAKGLRIQFDKVIETLGKPNAKASKN